MECSGDGRPLALQALRVQTGAAATDGLRRQAGESGKERCGNGRVADPDLAEHNHIAPLRENCSQRVAGGNGCSYLVRCQRGAERDVCTSRRDSMIDHTWQARAGQADIRDDKLGAEGACKNSDGGFATCCCRCNLCANTCGIQTDRMAGHAMIGCEHQDADARIGRRQCPARHRPSFDQGFEAAETAHGFHQLIGCVADTHRGGGIAGHDLGSENVPPVRQLETAWRVAGSI